MEIYDFYYKLVGNEIVKCKSIEEMEKAYLNRWQIKTEINNKLVSTVFLALDHNWTCKGTPLLFETMIFPESKLFARYHTLNEAIAGHNIVVDLIKKGEKIENI